MDEGREGGRDGWMKEGREGGRREGGKKQSEVHGFSSYFVTGIVPISLGGIPQHLQ